MMSTVRKKFIQAAIGLCLLLSMQWAVASTIWRLDQLMQELASIEATDLVFEEQRKSAVLTKELHVSGKMVYRAPEYLEKHILKPFVERVIVNGDEMKVVKFNRKGKKKVKIYSVESHKLLNSVIKVIRAVFNGDTNYLLSQFDLNLSGERENWQLTMLPINKKIKRYLDKVILEGENRQISKVTTFESDGDQIQTKLIYKLIQ